MCVLQEGSYDGHGRESLRRPSEDAHMNILHPIFRVGCEPEQSTRPDHICHRAPCWEWSSHTSFNKPAWHFQQLGSERKYLDWRVRTYRPPPGGPCVTVAPFECVFREWDTVCSNAEKGERVTVRLYQSVFICVFMCLFRFNLQDNCTVFALVLTATAVWFFLNSADHQWIKTIINTQLHTWKSISMFVTIYIIYIYISIYLSAWQHQNLLRK